MCGVGAVVRFDGGADVREIVSAMSARIKHRGPDGCGVFTHDGVGLAHRRLSIIDLSEQAAQPMTYLDRYVLSYNGEIYNYIEIREELKGRGYRFTSSGDAQVVVAAYAEWGSECVHRFNGMWAILIYDTEQRTLFASRDRFGIKPLYFARDGQKILFSSEIRQILPHLSSVRVNPDTLADFLVLNLSQHSENTFFESVSQFPQAHSMTILPDGTTKLDRYYELAADPAVASYAEDEALQSFGDLLRDSVRLRLRSDVPVGTCLSGGLDSSTITAIAAAKNPRLIGITAVSEEVQSDESRWAAAVTEKLSLDWHTVAIDRGDFLAEARRAAAIQEEPFPTASILLQQHVFQCAAKVGCKVMLDGQGGDETLLGYERYYASYLWNLPARERIAAISQIARNSKLRRKDVLQYLLYFLSPTVRRFLLRKRAQEHVSPELLGRIDWGGMAGLAQAYRDPAQMQIAEISRFQLPKLLMYEDKNSMSHSIESRLPFLDYRLVEFATSMNPGLKIRFGWSKWALRKLAAEMLPEEIAWRRHKVGFEAPSSTLLSDHKEPMAALIRQSSIWNNFGRRGIDVTQLKAREFWKWFFIAGWEDAFSVES